MIGGKNEGTRTVRSGNQHQVNDAQQIESRAKTEDHPFMKRALVYAHILQSLEKLKLSSPGANPPFQCLLFRSISFLCVTGKIGSQRSALRSQDPALVVNTIAWRPFPAVEGDLKNINGCQASVSSA